MPQQEKPKKKAVRSSKPLGSSPSMGPMAPIGAAIGAAPYAMMKRKGLAAPSTVKKATVKKATAKKKK
jgi:hypothetical protein